MGWVSITLRKYGKAMHYIEIAMGVVLVVLGVMLFAGIFERHSAEPANALMAGDSMRSDIIPALEAGAWAAYIPQPLTWSHEQRPAPADNPRFVELPSLAALVNWLDRAEAA